ncbi:phage tail protein, partial [Serratia fonticola]|uniref:phage tail protein n=1 Tax=Serratia fonticola TaxID=47917 RepID=UPI001376C16C
MGSKGGGKVTVGYRYSWDIQAGLGRGPINEIVAITADKKTVFAGYEGQLSSSTTLFIDKPNLFGGDDTGGEGGIQGIFEVAMGEADQVPSPNVLKLLSGLVPGFRGMVTTFFSGLISCYSASPKPWAYRNRRTTKGWDRDIVWYPEKCLIRLENTQAQIDGQDEMTPDVIANLRAIHAMNPAHILVECATNRDWGRGLLLNEDLDLDSYRYAADQLYAEGFGLCFRYNRQDSLDTFVQQMLDHIGAAQYGDLSTGKTTLKLIRDDYNPDDLPLFTYDNGIIAVQDDDSTSSDTAPNEITVTYHDPVTNSDGEVRAQNLGSIQSVGLISSSVEYKAIPTHDLAARVAQRDLEVGSAGITRLVIQFDRRGGQLTPASCFRVSLPDRNIVNMVLRVSKIDETNTGALTITAVQDVFGLPATSYSSGQQGSGWTPPDKTAVPVTDMQLVELPYFTLAATLSAADLSFVSPEACYLGVMATAPTSFSVNYHLQSRAAGAEFADRGRGDWTTSATLLTAVEPLDTELHVSMTFPPVVGGGIIIGNEVIRVDAVDMANSKLTVGRACADTLPQQHVANVRLRFLGSAIESDGQEYLGGENVDVRLLTRTSTATLDASLAPISSLQMRQRQYRPYMPGDIRVNGISYPSVVAVADTYRLTYAHRDRVLQADQLIDCLFGSIGPEPGTQYIITLTRQDTQVVVWTLATDELLIDLPYSSEDSPDAAVHVLTLRSRRDGIDSLYRYQAQLPVGQYVPEPEPE